MAVVVFLLSVVVALVVVRLSLDWSDSLPYEGRTTENRYLLFILVAVALVAAGAVIAVRMWRRAGRR
jgi:hypothetical protein